MLLSKNIIRQFHALQPLALLALNIVLACPAYGQVAGATLSGTVTDASGSTIPQAQVSITNLSTGITTAVAVNSDGFYTAPNLPAGNYEMSASAAGFATEVRRGIALTVGAQQLLNFTLQVGQIAEKVQVTGEAPAVELVSSTIGGVVDPTTIVELPLNGRDWTLLAALQPGVSTNLEQRPNSQTGIRGNRGFGQQLSISGTRPQLNNYRLDGISIVDYSGGSPGSVVGVALGVDAIAEFSVLTSNYDAEYGRTSGGVINAITKSGTNQIHGDAYWFLRDDHLDAENYFENTVAPFHRNQFGASVGGPIQKDKTFFFVDYEGFRQALGVTNVDKVPSQDARDGIIHNADGTTCTIGIPSPGCMLTNSAGTVGVDPKVAPYLSLWPLPNAGLIAPGNTGLFDIATSNVTPANFVTTKIDRKMSPRDSISGSWFYETALADQPDPLNDTIVGSTSAQQMISLEETHIFGPSLVNSLRGGYSRVHDVGDVGLSAINPLSADLSLGFFPGLAAGSISVPGLTTFGGGVVPAGLNYAWNSFQVYDDAFLTKGVHSLKFGFAFERMQTNMNSPGRLAGSYGFGSLTGFLTDEPTTAAGVVQSSISRRGVRQSLFGGYLQDDWRLRPNFTLNLGLRYEMVTVPTEVNNKLVNLPTFTTPYPGHIGSPFFSNPTYRNFEPRVGFSWDPFHNGKTAVRGAFGIFDALPLNYEFFVAETQSAPFAENLTISSLPAGGFPMGSAASGTVVPSNLQSVSIQPNPPRNYVMIWNLNVQRQLNSSTAVTVGYVGNHGVHMENRADDVNLVLPALTPEGYLWPFPAGSGTRLNPTVGAIRGIYWDGDAEYDALEVQVSKRMSHGFQAQGSYTWGKSIDTGSASTLGDPFLNSVSSPFWFCKSCRRGLSDFNIGQTLVVNLIWDVPTPKNWGAVGEYVLGGWELGSIITVETGVPITPKIAGDPLGLKDNDLEAYPNRLTGPGCGSAVNPGNPKDYINLSCFGLPVATPAIAAECTPFGAPSAPIAGTCSNLLGDARRNSIIGPGLATWDFSLFKNNYIKKVSENFDVQLRGEFFNILNRANFATPVDNETLFDQSGNPVPGAGAIDSTSTTSRQIQVAVKVIF
jgi:outer membrane receptor protein involved in Fe transport